MQMGVFFGSRLASMRQADCQCPLSFSSLGVEVTARKKLSRCYQYGSDRTAPEFCVYPISPFYHTALTPVVIQGQMDAAWNVYTRDDEWLATTQRQFNALAMDRAGDREVYMQRLIADEDALRWFWFCWTEPPRADAMAQLGAQLSDELSAPPTAAQHSLAELWNGAMMEEIKDDMKSYPTHYGIYALPPPD